MNTPDIKANQTVTSAFRRTHFSMALSAAIATMVSPGARAQSDPNAPPASQPAASAPAASAPAPASAADKRAAPNDDQPPTKPRGVPQVLEQVTISATRRREPAREVPIVVNTMSAESLEKSGARTLSDYLAVQPGVDFKGDGAGLGAISVRGVSTGDQPIATVGVYIDDVAFGSHNANLAGATTALDMSLLDLNRIELLRGPQGTLYGAGSMGGLLKYVTNEPDSSGFSGTASLGGSATRGGRPGDTVSTVLNIPLKTDVAAVRLAAFRQHEGGYIDATGRVGGRAINGGDTTGARAALLVEPSAQFKVRLTALGQEIKRDGIGAVDYDIATGRPVGGEFSRALDVREPYSIKIGLVSADIESNMDWARFNSITSVQSSSLSRHRDFTVFAALLGDPDIATVPQSSHVTQRRQTQEFRLTSLTKGPIEWLAGFYYEHETGSNDQDIGTTLVDGSAGPSLATVRGPASYIETALYGDLTWNATDKLALTGGVRAARNRQTYSQNTDGPLLGGATNRVGYSAESSQTYLVTARYKLTPASSAYLRAASGYRPGGPNDVIKDQTTGLPLAPPTFQHDTLWSYEAGYKADLLGKTLSLEAALYDIRWKQIQDFENVNGVSVIVNNGKARIKGVELSARYLPTPEWDLRASLAFNDAHALETIADQVTAGDRLPNSARLSAALAVNRNFQFAGLASYAGATVRYVGDRNAGFDASTTLPNYRLPAYALTDLQAGAQFGQFALQLYLRNAFDRSAQLNASTSAVPLGGPVLVTPARPRTFGVNWVASF